VMGPHATDQGSRLSPMLSRAEVFLRAVHHAIARIQRTCPEALEGIDIGVEDVPRTPAGTDQVPLVAAVEGMGDEPTRVVIYRRPLELRAATRHGLGILVHRTLVEQLSAITTRPVHDIDPGLNEDG